ncbi:MAG: hypothetical protein M5U33_08350 [Pseudorhodoplanes sp.]|nr:hypothetical protein [Pseudorhodoplanes sp.]MCZ7642720.1 hypothetical protein [Pseudorhodoplanes sp.]GIK81773.1 MAG: hypothetical protein BroJett024_28780 [Alphaproteobacteria bacterium]
MGRVLAILACGLAVAGCASGSDALKSATPTLTLQFESEPAGAEVKTSGGQTCKTPCALAVPAADLVATYTLKGYKPQTVPVKLVPPDDLRADGEAGTTTPSPRFNPSPVVAELEAAPAPRRTAPARPARPARAPAAETAPAQPAMPPPAAATPPSGSTAWPPPPAAPGQVR